MQSFWSCQGPLLHILMEKQDGVKNIPSKLSFSIHHFYSNSHKEIKGSIYMPVVFVHKHQKDILSIILHKIQVTFILEFSPRSQGSHVSSGREAGWAGAAKSTQKCVFKLGESNSQDWWYNLNVHTKAWGNTMQSLHKWFCLLIICAHCILVFKQATLQKAHF